MFPILKANTNEYLTTMANIKTRKLTREEFERIEQYLKRQGDLRRHCMISTCYYTGYRINEVLSLRVRDVLLPNGKIVGKLHISPARMKKKTPRDPVPLHKKVQRLFRRLVKEVIDEYREGDRMPEKAGDLFLFQSNRKHNKPLSYTQAWRDVKDVYDACDIYDRVACHSMRKGFAENVYENTGKNILATQKALGHTSPDTTIKYIDIEEETIRNAILSV